MNTMRSPLLLLCVAALIAGCKPGVHVSTDTGNVSIDGDSITLRANGQPEAIVTAAGDLSIDGKAIVVNDAQRGLLRSYHTELNAMTADGIAIGKQGAALAGTAVTEAIKGAIRGDGGQVDTTIEAETRKIEQQALQMCKRLVTVKASQDALAAQIPAFKPYATIDGSDIDDCGTSERDSYAAGKQVGGSLARAVKGGDEHEGDAASPGDAAAEADAAAESDASSR